MIFLPKCLNEKSFTPYHFREKRLKYSGKAMRELKKKVFPFAFHQKSGTGFTLIELLVVISIIILITGIVFLNYRPGQSQLALQRAASKLAQDLRRVQEMAMSAKEYQDKVPAGYGIYLKQGDNYYLLYADTNPAQGNEIYDGGDKVVEKIYLEKRVYIKNVRPASLSINFKPPDPKTKISGSRVIETNLATITLSLETEQTKEKIIKVNKAGLIYVE